MAYTPTTNKHTQSMLRNFVMLGSLAFLEWTTLWPWFATASSRAIYFSVPATYFLSPFIISILAFSVYRVYSLWKDFQHNPTRSAIIEVVIATLGAISMAFSITVILMMTFGGPVVFAAAWVPSLFFVGGLVLTLLKRLVYDIAPKLFTLFRLSLLEPNDDIDQEQTKANLWQFIHQQSSILPFLWRLWLVYSFALPYHL